LILLLLNFTKSVNQFSWPMKKIVHGAIIAFLIIIIFKTVQEFAIDYIFVVKCFLLIMFLILSLFTKLIGEKEINGVKYLWHFILRKI